MIKTNASYSFDDRGTDGQRQTESISECTLNPLWPSVLNIGRLTKNFNFNLRGDHQKIFL